MLQKLLGWIRPSILPADFGKLPYGETRVMYVVQADVAAPDLLLVELGMPQWSAFEVTPSWFRVYFGFESPPNILDSNSPVAFPELMSLGSFKRSISGTLVAVRKDQNTLVLDHDAWRTCKERFLTDE